MGLVAVPLVASVLAIVFGRSAQATIARDPSTGGDGLARAGIILGWVGVALVTVFLLFLVLLLGAA